MIKKGLIILMTIGMVYAMSSIAFAIQESGIPPGTKGEIIPNQYDKVNNSSLPGPYGTGDYHEYVQGAIATSTIFSDTLDISAHVYGTWNSPYTWGVDGYNYNDPQDYVADGDQDPANAYRFQSGPHGGYLTTTHKCRECHAVHRAAGKFKLMRANTRFEACDWCHGTGAGSGFNIETDNDDNYTTEYNTGHTMGFGIQSGKWKAPDDTYPAFTPNYWLGGFSCFDCHSPHANPQRLLGYDNNGQVKGLAYADPSYYSGQTRYYSITNPGHGAATDPPGDSISCVNCHKKIKDANGNFVSGTPSAVPLYQSGSWLLVKDADREMAETSEVISYYKLSDALDTTGTIETTQIVAGNEISDAIYAYTENISGEPSVTAGLLRQFDRYSAYPVNKVPIDWNNPIGIAKAAYGSAGFDMRSAIPYEPSHALIWNISEFCTDCHDGNSGLHTIQAPLFSEDRALRNQSEPRYYSTDSVTTIIETDTTTWKGEYDLAYGHDQNPRHCGRQMQFNPEDNTVFGPHCRNCHKGSSDCGRCHSESSGADNNLAKAIYPSQPPYTEAQALTVAANNNRDRAPAVLTQDVITGDWIWVDEYPGLQGQSMLHVKKTSAGETNMVFDYNFSTPHGLAPNNANLSFMFKKSRTVAWDSNWRTSVSPINSSCGDDGFSWPHRTLGWKLLKDDLFGLNFDGTPVGMGQTRTYDTNGDGTPETYAVHDLDSVCLDCHNPTVWRATSSNHTDTAGTTTDDFNDELLLRGLP